MSRDRLIAPWPSGVMDTVEAALRGIPAGLRHTVREIARDAALTGHDAGWYAGCREADSDARAAAGADREKRVTLTASAILRDLDVLDKQLRQDTYEPGTPIAGVQHAQLEMLAAFRRYVETGSFE